MNRAGRPISVALASLLLAGLLLGALWIIQPGGGVGAGATTIANPTPIGYPAIDTIADYTPIGYPVVGTPGFSTPPPWATAEPDVTMITTDDLTPLWFTPEPTLTATPSLEGSAYYDQFNKFNVTLSAGWYAIPPVQVAEAVSGATYLSNYDMMAMDTWPDYGIRAQIVVVSLDEGMTFDEWVEDRRQKITAPELADLGPGGEVGASSSQRLGAYTGVSFTVHNPRDVDSNPGLEIYLLADDGRIIAIGIIPSNSTDFPALLSILDTIALAPPGDP